jgi:hypothetical protein
MLGAAEKGQLLMRLIILDLFVNVATMVVNTLDLLLEATYVYMPRASIVHKDVNSLEKRHETSHMQFNHTKCNFALCTYFTRCVVKGQHILSECVLSCENSCGFFAPVHLHAQHVATECPNIKCANNGCNFIGNVVDRDNHVVECAFKEYFCDACHKVILYKTNDDILLHVKKCAHECINCEYCGLLVMRQDERYHVMDCSSKLSEEFDMLCRLYGVDIVTNIANLARSFCSYQKESTQNDYVYPDSRTMLEFKFALRNIPAHIEQLQKELAQTKSRKETFRNKIYDIREKCGHDGGSGSDCATYNFRSNILDECRDVDSD